MGLIKSFNVVSYHEILLGTTFLRLKILSPLPSWSFLHDYFTILLSVICKFRHRHSSPTCELSLRFDSSPSTNLSSLNSPSRAQRLRARAANSHDYDTLGFRSLLLVREQTKLQSSKTPISCGNHLSRPCEDSLPPQTENPPLSSWLSLISFFLIVFSAILPPKSFFWILDLSPLSVIVSPNLIPSSDFLTVILKSRSSWSLFQCPECSLEYLIVLPNSSPSSHSFDQLSLCSILSFCLYEPSLRHTSSVTHISRHSRTIRFIFWTLTGCVTGWLLCDSNQTRCDTSMAKNGFREFSKRFRRLIEYLN